jgi:hypothetical protein
MSFVVQLLSIFNRPLVAKLLCTLAQTWFSLLFNNIVVVAGVVE